MIQSPILVRDGRYGFRCGNWDICRHRLRRMFDLPAKTMRIQFKIFNTPGKGRTEMKFIPDYGVWVVGELYRDYLMDYTRKELCSYGLVEGVYYVELFYWE